MIDSDIIILDKNLANMIAAGEVVERPASVVKELVENALDAGATDITVEIKKGGKTYIRVSDNGCGMTKPNAKKAFLRHATSKIKKHEDLYSIKTMGFRGEALAAIASVSKVEIFTSTVDDAYGTHLVLEGGDEVSCGEMGLARGTTIVVKDLFYNTPARYNFLKKDSTESANIVSLVHKLAISRPYLSLTLIVDGKQALSVDKDSNMIDVIYSVLGKEICDNLIQINKCNARVLVEGFVSKPRCSRSNRNYQMLFVNGRYVRSKTVTAALDKAYRNTLMNGKHPVAVLFIDIDPEKTDVNIHPTKMEIKFSDESLVFDMVFRAVKEGLEKEVQFNEEVKKYAQEEKTQGYRSPIIQQVMEYFNQNNQELKKPDEPKTILTNGVIERFEARKEYYDNDPELHGSRIAPPEPPADPIKGYSPRQAAKLLETGYYTRRTKLDISELSLKYCKDMYDDSYIITNDIPYRYVGELFKTYIIIESGQLYYLVDKHAAHERILFNKIYERYKNQDNYQQFLLDAIPISLSPEEADVAHRYREQIGRYGYEFSEFGDNDILLRTVPFVISPGDTVSSFVELIEIFNETGEAGITEYENNIMKMLACKGAIKAGFDSDDLELEYFIRELIMKGNINYCPHGRPIICEYSRKDVEKAFKRRV